MTYAEIIKKLTYARYSVTITYPLVIVYIPGQTINQTEINTLLDNKVKCVQFGMMVLVEVQETPEDN